jgi:hypothetical protein
VFYAGGGGGGSNSYLGIGGAGGGGDGGVNTGSIRPTAGLANTGGGGGGITAIAGFVSGAGGSGIVIIRYPANCAPPTSTTGNPQINISDGYQVYTWTSSGTVTF